MHVNYCKGVTFGGEETILTATLSKPGEVVMLLSSGDIARYNLDELNGKGLFSIKSDITYGDGGFDLAARSTIYTLDEIVVVVNDFKRHGIVHYPGRYHSLHISRTDYHAGISVFPIALYKNKNGVPHLIFAEAWNHIQIMNLDTRQVLTAAKSLIEEQAEEKHIEFYKKYGEDNKLMWPRPYDYFFGKLWMSPGQHAFLSAGWGWGSFDCYNVYDVEQFVTSSRISELRLGAWEHDSRAVCWMDDDIIAVAYSPSAEGDDDATADSLYEIHLLNVSDRKVEIVRKIPIADKDFLRATMYFDKARGLFVCLSDSGGVTIISLDGEIVFRDDTLKAVEYNTATGLFLQVDDKTVAVYEVRE